MEFDATFLIALLSFIVFIFIMNKVFYAPVLKIMQERQSFVEQNYDSAKTTKNEIKNKSEYMNSELEKSRNEARNMIAENSQNLKIQKSKKISEYKENLYNSITEQKDTLRDSAISAKEVLKDNVVDLAKEISQKILGSSVTTETIDKSQIKEQG